MRPLRSVGPYADVVQAPSSRDPTNTVNLGVRTETFRRYESRGLGTVIAQYYGIVQEDMPLARHVFRGLKRPLMLAGDMEADESVVVYTWRSQVDFEWIGSRFDGYPETKKPPGGRVFVVLVREEEIDVSGVSGTIEKWNWVYEDVTLPHAPIDWDERYEEKLWSRGE